jgi:hypothetical protein
VQEVENISSIWNPCTVHVVALATAKTCSFMSGRENEQPQATNTISTSRKSDQCPKNPSNRVRVYARTLLEGSSKLFRDLLTIERGLMSC